MPHLLMMTGDGGVGWWLIQSKCNAVQIHSIQSPTPQHCLFWSANYDDFGSGGVAELPFVL